LYFDSSQLEDGNKCPLVVIIHGGYWKARYTIATSLVDTLPSDLVRLGYMVYMIEYRRLDGETDYSIFDEKSENGGWPNSNNDITNALKQLASEHDTYTDKLVTDTCNGYVIHSMSMKHSQV
jgi:hypothetical protein